MYTEEFGETDIGNVGGVILTFDPNKTYKAGYKDEIDAFLVGQDLERHSTRSIEDQEEVTYSDILVDDAYPIAKKAAEKFKLTIGGESDSTYDDPRHDEENDYGYTYDMTTLQA